MNLDEPEREVLRRSQYADLIALLDTKGAKGLALDIMFRSPGDPEEDRALELAILKPRDLRLALACGEPLDPENRGKKLSRELDYPVVAEGNLPGNVMLCSAIGMAYSGRFAGAELLQPGLLEGSKVPYIGFAAAMQMLGLGLGDVLFDEKSSRVLSRTRDWTLDGDGVYNTAFTKDSRAIPEMPLYELIQAVKSGEFDPRGMYFLLGSEKDQVLDSTLGNLPAYYLAAQVANSALGKHPAPPATILQNSIWTFLLCLVSAFTLDSRSRTVKIIGPIVSILAAVAVPVVLMRWVGIWYETLNPLSCLIVSTVVALVTLSLPTISRRSRMGVVETEAVVLFSDLAGSTKIAQEMGALEYQNFLSVIHDAQGSIVRKNGGRVERLIGDGMMAVFQQRAPQRSIRALRAATGINEAVERLGETMASAITSRCAFESGPVSVRELQSANRVEVSTDGPTVNLAARLEKAAKSAGTPLAFGPMAAKELEGIVSVESLGLQSIDGYAEPIEVFTVTGNIAHEGD